MSLNPCSNGIAIECLLGDWRCCPWCLNPCSNGIAIEYYTVDGSLAYSLS